jgi:uncharacterized protein GlcG (DUF336 family)
MKVLTLGRARTLIDAALTAARDHDFRPMAVVVVDAAAQILDAAGALLGAAGASGGTGDQDEQIVIAGIRATGLC